MKVLATKMSELGRFNPTHRIRISGQHENQPRIGILVELNPNTGALVTRMQIEHGVRVTWRAQPEQDYEVTWRMVGGKLTHPCFPIDGVTVEPITKENAIPEPLGTYRAKVDAMRANVEAREAARKPVIIDELCRLADCLALLQFAQS